MMTPGSRAARHASPCILLLLLLLLLAPLGCSGSGPAATPVDDASARAPEVVASTPDGIAAAADAAAPADRLPGDPPVEDVGPAGDAPCASHDDCACADGVCLSTGTCWCPPCLGDEDCGAGQTCHAGACLTPSPSCEGPLRVTPDHGPTSGGTLLTFHGGEFHVGALEWWARIGDGPWLAPLYGVPLVDGPPCTISFYTAPSEPGTFPVQILYGWPPFDPAEEPGGAGTFTYLPADGQVGHGACSSDYQCEPWLETCDLGSGTCVPDLCRSVQCPEDAPLCDPVEGCLDSALTCAASTDCHLIYSSCSCHAVHVDDPRTAITSCAYDACADCKANHCDLEPVEAICSGGRCVERRGDATGVSCYALAVETLASELQSPGWIGAPRGAPHGDAAALVWTQPSAFAQARNGVIRLAMVDEDGASDGGLALLDGDGGLDTNPAVASDGTSLAAVWVVENPDPTVLFQAFDDAGGPVGAHVELGGPADEWVAPRIVRESGAEAGGFRALWVRDGEYDSDGLYHARVSPAGALTGPLEYVPWVLPSLESFAAASVAGALVVAWPGSYPGLEDLYLGALPPATTPVQVLSDPSGSEVDLLWTGDTLAVVWRESVQTSTGAAMRLYFQTFDVDLAPLSPPVLVTQHQPALYGPRVAYLGAVFLVTWFEYDSFAEEDPKRLMARQLTEAGAPLGQPAPALDDAVDTVGHLHVRVGERLLTALVERGELSDRLRFLRWQCAAD